MTKKQNFIKIILYGDKIKYEQLKEKLQGIPVSVWFRVRMDEALKKNEIKI